MAEIDLAQPSTVFRPALSAALLKFTGRKEEGQLSLEERWVLDYLSANVMERFLPSYALSLGTGRIDSLTDAIIHEIRTRRDPFGHFTANFSLFMTSVFYEFLESRRLGSFYEDVGISSYNQLRHAATIDEFRTLYGMLAENFVAYETVIRTARDDSGYFGRRADWFRIVPYKKSLTPKRTRVVTVN